MSKIRFPFLLLAVALTLASCGTAPEPTDETMEEPAATEPATDTAVGETQETISLGDSPLVPDAHFNGTLVLPPKGLVSVTLSLGGTVRNVNLLPGAKVERGQTICMLENFDFITLQQTFLENHAQREYLKQEYQRQETLASEEAASKKRLQQSRAEYLAVEAKVAATAAQLRLLGIDTSRLITRGIEPLIRVAAPSAGYLSNMKINEGLYVEAGTSLCDVIGTTAPLIRLLVFEKDLARFALGNELRFSVNGIEGKDFRAVVQTIGRSVSTEGRAVEIYLRPQEANPNFRAGMYVNAWLPGIRK